MMTLPAVRQTIAAVLRPSHFYAGPGLKLQWHHQPTAETPWEIFRGQLAPNHLTREFRIFETWCIYALRDGQRSGEPLLSLKLDAERGQIHVVRGLLCWVWEGYQAGDNVFESREVPRWVRELIGTLELSAFDSEDSLRQELALWIFRAVVGLSRLPLTSAEAPLPGFSLGELAYFGTPRCMPLPGARESEPLSEWRQLVALDQLDWPPQLQTKWLEFLLRSTLVDDLPQAAAACMARWQEREVCAASVLAQLRAVFNEVALSPYTEFVDNTLAFLRQLVQQQFFTSEQHIDFLGWLLRQLARHLSAYDLNTFHHRGANYPDALLLDAALKEYLRLLDQHVAAFEGSGRAARLRRRALRLSWLHRRRYEGHPVPDAPTSPGENARILPSWVAPASSRCGSTPTSPGENARILPPLQVRVPEEQILNVGKRKKRLYRGDPLPSHAGPHAQRVLPMCGRDLEHEEELRELGMALFIERPLGAVKAPGEPDLSPLLAHEAFSRALAERALMELAREPLLSLTADHMASYRLALANIKPDGLLANTLPAEPPRVVSLADATKAAADFIIVRTLPSGVQAFCTRPDVAAVLRDWGIKIDNQADWLIVGNVTAAGRPGLLIRDAKGRQNVQLEVDRAQRVQLSPASDQFRNSPS
jgi:hypothetical protein